jgi:hypothetical protein
MNLNNISKREVLDFDQFRTKVHDDNFKPLAYQNQNGEPNPEKSGLHDIKREPAFDFVGYADSVFGGESKIKYAGLTFRDPDTGKIVLNPDSGGITHLGTELSESKISESNFRITRLSDF